MSIRARIRGPSSAPPARTIDYSEKFAPNGFTPGIAIRIASDGRYKLLRQDVPITRHEFYDLLRDPFEQRDLLLEVAMSAGEKAAFTKLGAHIDGLLR